MSSAINSDLVRPVRVTHAGVLKIALPMSLAHMSVPLVGLVDTAVIGRLGIAALIGGVAVATSIFAILFSTFNFLRSSTTGLAAQALGADDRSELQAVLARGLIIAMAMGVGFILLHRPLIALGLWFMDAEPSVQQAAQTYLQIRIWSAPFVLLSYVVMGWLLGLARAAVVMALQILLALVNTILSIILVLGFELGIAGLAWGSVVAEIVVVLSALPFVVSSLPKAHRPPARQIFDQVRFLRLASVNRDIMIRSLALLFALAFFTRQGAQLGEVILAANAILMHFFVISGHFLDSVATAAEQIIGRSIGARNRPAFLRGLRLTLFWSLLMAGMLAGLYALAGPLLISIMTTAPDVRLVASEYLVWAALTPIAGILAFQMDGVFIGATWSRDMRNMMLASLAIYLAACFIFVPLWNNHGLWLALLVFLGARGATMAARLPVRMRTAFAGLAPG